MHGIDRQQRQAFADFAAPAAIDAAWTARMRRRDDALLDIPRRPLGFVRRAEKRDGRRAHRCGEMHRHRIHADEEMRPRSQRAEFLE